MTMTTRVVGLLLVGFLLAGCQQESPGPVGQQRLPAPVGTIEPDFMNGTVRVFANSARIRPGVPYDFRLYTHCGLEKSTPDFDGSLWDFGGADTVNPARGFGNPVDDGTMTLVSEDVSQYRSSLGVILNFRRHNGAKVIPACF
jgi:hypothetical protein